MDAFPVPVAHPQPLPFERLPVFPAVALELIEMLDAPEASMQQISRLLRREPTMAAEILKVANSALYQRRQAGVVDLDMALVLIGLAKARRVSLNAAVRGLIGSALGMPELRRCWAHSVATAMLAERLSGDYEILPGRAYAMGLLHDLGALALLALYSEEYSRMMLLIELDESDWRASERLIFGIDHEQAGAQLVHRMGLPASMGPVLSSHHDCDLSSRDAVSLVGGASLLADSLGLGIGAEAKRRRPEDVLRLLPLRDEAGVLAALKTLTHQIQVAVT